VGSEVDVARHERQPRHLRLSAHLEELLQLLRLPVQAIGVPDHDRVEEAAAQIVEHTPIRRARMALVGAHVVVDVARVCSHSTRAVGRREHDDPRLCYGTDDAKALRD
jgi:hypothetical protein